MSVLGGLYLKLGEVQYGVTRAPLLSKVRPNALEIIKRYGAVG